MSNRIALMVRGLPSVPIEDAVERFGKYYAPPKEGVFHSSESFPKGYSSPSGTITFVDKQGGYQGGGGLTKSAMRDLRQLQADFEAFTSENPSIYNANPTTKSRAKLYSRAIGAKNLPDGWGLQAIDTRRIAEADFPYVQAIDVSVLPSDIKSILRPNVLESFIGDGDRVVAASRIPVLKRIMQGSPYVNSLPNFIDRAFEQKVAKRLGRVDDNVFGRTRLSAEDSEETIRAREISNMLSEIEARERAEATNLGMSTSDYYAMRSRQAEENMRQRMAERLGRARQGSRDLSPSSFALTMPLAANDYDDTFF